MCSYIAYFSQLYFLNYKWHLKLQTLLCKLFLKQFQSCWAIGFECVLYTCISKIEIILYINFYVLVLLQLKKLGHKIIFKSMTFYDCIILHTWYAL